MSPRTARSISMAVVGGVAALVFFRAGLLFWVGLVGWAALGETGEDPTAMKKTIGGAIFGACVAWAGIVVSLLVPVPPEGWLWVPRLAAAVAVSLFVLEMGSGVELFSRRSASLLGYASVFGVAAIALAEAASTDRFTGLHLSNPLIATVIALVGGALAGRVAHSLTGTLAKT